MNMEHPASQPPEIPKQEQLKPQTNPAEVRAFMEQNTALFAKQLEEETQKLEKLEQVDPDGLEIGWTRERIKELKMILKNRAEKSN